jgi:hypothetical protein
MMPLERLRALSRRGVVAVTYTAIELARDGTRTVFHRRGNKSWTHPEGTPTMQDFDRTLTCPECVPVEERKIVAIRRGRPRKTECDHGHGAGEWGTLSTGYGYCRRCKRDRKQTRVAPKTPSPGPEDAPALAPGVSAVATRS